MNPADHPVLVVLAISVIAPLLAEAPIGFRLPPVVLEIALGIVVGPFALGLAKNQGAVQLLGQAGLSFLFFLAGAEIQLERLRGRPLSLAAQSWGASLILGLATAFGLYSIQFVHAPEMVAVALTTTSAGMLVPIVRDAGEMETKFGTLLMAAAAMGEFGPLMAVSIIFARGHSYSTQTTRRFG